MSWFTPQVAIGLGKTLGGLFGSKGPGPHERYRMAEEHAYNLASKQPSAQRAGMEAAGFNPNLLFGGGGFMQAQPSLIGDSYSTNGALFSDGLDMVHDDLIRQTALSKENEKLREALDEVAKPSEPAHMERYGDVLPLPSKGSQNVSQTGLVPVSDDLLDDINGGDLPYVPGTVWNAEPVGSQRLEAEKPTKTMQPISLFGMTLRGTGATTAAHIVEDNAGEAASMAWAVPAIGDYALGTYLHNIGRPFAKHVAEPYAKAVERDRHKYDGVNEKIDKWVKRKWGGLWDIHTDGPTGNAP